jgi:hypothetical protein
MESVVNSDIVVTMVVDCVSKQLKAYSVPCSIITARMSPRCRDKEVSVYGLMQ